MPTCHIIQTINKIIFGELLKHNHRKFISQLSPSFNQRNQVLYSHLRKPKSVIPKVVQNTFYSWFTSCNDFLSQILRRMPNAMRMYHLGYCISQLQICSSPSLKRRERGPESYSSVHAKKTFDLRRQFSAANSVCGIIKALCKCFYLLKVFIY